MGKPKKGRNGFFLYMAQRQQEFKRQGEDLPINSPKLHELAGNEWKSMTAEEKEPFNRRAKQVKDCHKHQRIGVTPKTERQETEEEDRESYLDRLIECCVNACPTTNELINASFFVVSSNVMLKTDSDEWYPLEIGICQYTIKDGLKFTYHQFIDAGKVPTGYMHRAKSWSEDSHKIPIENFYAASNNYQRIVEDITQILDESRFTDKLRDRPTPMMVYSHESQIDQNTGVFKWLAKMYKNESNQNCGFSWDIEVMDLCNLLYHISKSVGRPIPPALGYDYLTTSEFDYSANTDCYFHEDMDNKNCARGGARRHCYMMSNALCPLFDIKLTDNHLPPKRDSVVTESYKMPLQEIRPQPINRYVPYQSDDQWEPDKSDEGPIITRPLYTIGIGRGRPPGWGCSNR